MYSTSTYNGHVYLCACIHRCTCCYEVCPTVLLVHMKVLKGASSVADFKTYRESTLFSTIQVSSHENFRRVTKITYSWWRPTFSFSFFFLCYCLLPLGWGFCFVCTARTLRRNRSRQELPLLDPRMWMRPVLHFLVLILYWNRTLQILSWNAIWADDKNNSAVNKLKSYKWIYVHVC